RVVPIEVVGLGGAAGGDVRIVDVGLERRHRGGVRDVVLERLEVDRVLGAAGGRVAVVGAHAVAAVGDAVGGARAVDAAFPVAVGGRHVRVGALDGDGAAAPVRRAAQGVVLGPRQAAVGLRQVGAADADAGAVGVRARGARGPRRGVVVARGEEPQHAGVLAQGLDAGGDDGGVGAAVGEARGVDRVRRVDPGVAQDGGGGDGGGG